MTDPINKKINKYAKDDLFIIFYSDWCPYCKKTFQLLKQTNQKYKGYDIDKIGGMDKLLEKLKAGKSKTHFNKSHKTRPVVFYKGKFIGGYDDLKLFIKKIVNK